MAKISQDLSAFTWEDRQWTFQVLQQWYVHSPMYCCNLVACDLVEWDKPDNVKLYLYIDDLMLISASLEMVEKTVGSLSKYLQEEG